MTTLGPAVALGFVLGLQHATDADHLVAVATIVTRSRRFRDGVLVGVLWGLGHAVTLTLAGGGVILLNVTLPEALTTGLELMVAAAIGAHGGDDLSGRAGAALPARPSRAGAGLGRGRDHVRDRVLRPFDLSAALSGRRAQRFKNFLTLPAMPAGSSPCLA